MTDQDTVEIYADPLWTRVGSNVNNHAQVSRERVPYQATLRAIGARLDGMRVCRINLLEVADGFMIRYQESQDDSQLSLLHCEHRELLSLSTELEHKRKRKGFSFSQKESSVGTYENVLRALGFELDQAEAYSLLIDELDDGMVVTYQYLRPSEDFQARKRMVILGAEAMAAVIEDAKSRRDNGKRGGMSLQAR